MIYSYYFCTDQLIQMMTAHYDNGTGSVLAQGRGKGAETLNCMCFLLMLLTGRYLHCICVVLFIFIYMVTSTAYLLYLYTDNVTTWMFFDVSLIMTVLIAIPKSSTDE